MKKQYKNLLLLMLTTGMGYYFAIYLPEQEKREWEKYQLAQKQARKKEQQQREAEEKALLNKQKSEAEQLRKQENIIKKKLHWRREREVKSWTHNWLLRKKDNFENTLKDLGGEENINIFSVATDYTIHFPPTVWNELTEEQKELAKSKGHNELELDEKTKNFRFNELVEEWEMNVTANPVRGEPDPDTEKDNNALFYGTGGTGKTSLVRRLAYNSDLYPLIEIKGSNLTPRKEDYDNGIDPLNKFIFTLCDIENTLQDDYGFEREANGEVRFILFVDEADNVCSNTALSTDYTRLIFLKTCMEGIDKNAQSQNLWIFATNYINLIDKFVYRPGRLSNPLDFSWTLGDFKYYADNANISPQFPSHWNKLDTLNDDDNIWMNKFNTMNFENEFLKFWDRFIHHPDTLKELVEEVEYNEKGEEIITKKGIQLGEFLEFFWRLFDSKQLHNFTGKFIKPNKPTVNELIPKITEALDVRLKELTEQLKLTNNELMEQKSEFTNVITHNTTRMSQILEQIAKNQ